MGKRLPYNQNIKAAKIFLDMFGLAIEESEDVKVGDVLKLFDSSGIEVGTINFLENEIYFLALTDLGVLKGSYKCPEMSEYIDTTEKMDTTFAAWNTDINYIIEKNELEYFKGTTRVDLSLDIVYGDKCLCHHSLGYFLEGKNNMVLVFLLNDKTFAATMWDNDVNEVIELMPYDDLRGYIRHDIKQGKYDVYKGYPYRKYSGIFSEGRKSGFLHEYSIVREYENARDVVNNFPYKEGFIVEKATNSVDTIIQMGRLMQNLDSDFFKKIAEIKTLLASGRISLFDSFLNTSLESYNDSVIEALFGTSRNPILNMSKEDKISLIRSNIM